LCTSQKRLACADGARFFDDFSGHEKGVTQAKMFPLLIVLLQQIRATQPTYFFLVTLALLIAGGIGWLIAAVLGFARSPAFGPSARWFSYAAVCLIIYHLQFLLFGVFVFLGMSQNSADLTMALGVGAFFNLFVVLAAVCAILGFVKMTNPR
jgi:hypothetical protein